jgi:regulator of protease activity HflC (stomatin/prohibitin superfamily)
MSPKHIGAAVAAVIAIALLLILNPITIIDAGHRGVVTSFGKVSDTILDEGIHWRTPIVQKVREIDVRTIKGQTETLAYSKDTQTVSIEGAVNFHLQSDAVNKLFQEIGVDYVSKVIDPAVQEAVKTTVAEYTAQELLDKRGEVKDKILMSVKDRLAPKYIVVEDYSIINFDFSDAYEQAVEAKQVAQQNALQAENKLKQVEFEAAQRVASAEAEAEAIRIQAQAINSQGGQDYVELQKIDKWDGKGCTSYCGMDASTGLLISR